MKRLDSHRGASPDVLRAERHEVDPEGAAFVGHLHRLEHGPAREGGEAMMDESVGAGREGERERGAGVGGAGCEETNRYDAEIENNAKITAVWCGQT